MWHPYAFVCLLLALAAAPLASAHVGATEFDVRENPFHGEENTWGGDRVYGFVDVALCYAPGETNPLEGDVKVSLVPARAPPVWVRMTQREDAHTLAPPLGPTLTAGCTDPAEFQITLDTVDDVVWGSTFEISFDVVPEANGDLGTYELPEGGTASFHVQVGPDPADDPLPPVDREPLGGDPEGVERPSPAAPGVLAVLLAGAAALRRGRWPRTRANR